MDSWLSLTSKPNLPISVFGKYKQFWKLLEENAVYTPVIIAAFLTDQIKPVILYGFLYCNIKRCAFHPHPNSFLRGLKK